MKNAFKKAILGTGLLALPIALSAAAYATVSLPDVIDTKLEYQVNNTGDSIRYISTMEMNGAELNNIERIDMDFDLSDGTTTKHSKTQSTTTVYDSISGDNGKDKVDDTYYAVLTITDLTTDYTGWRITPKFTYYYDSGDFEEVTASSWLIGGERVYFTNSYNWEQVSAFIYKEGVGPKAEWPGEAMTLLDAEHGVYYYDYLPSSGYDSIIFNNNNNGRQTEDILLDSNIHSYSLGMMKSDGKYKGLGFACTTHTWGTDYVTNGATHYHVCTECGAKSKIIDNNMQPVEGQDGIYQDQVTGYLGRKVSGYVYIQDSYYGSYSEGLNIHYWGGIDTPGTTWPGITINNDEHYFTTDMYGRNIYKVYIGDSTGLLLVTGDKSHQTGDTSPTNGNAFYLGDNWSIGAYNICETGALS